VTQNFLGRSRAIYHGMEKRFGAQLVQFTLDEFRAWLLGKFGDETKTIRCPYCRRVFISVFTCVIDHADPASRGGSLGLGNLNPCCSDCNDIKGALSVKAFMALLNYMEAIDPFDRQEITQRLQKSYKAVAAIHWRRKQDKKAKSQVAR
jgi:hypothetical protein